MSKLKAKFGVIKRYFGSSDDLSSYNSGLEYRKQRSFSNGFKFFKHLSKDSSKTKSTTDLQQNGDECNPKFVPFTKNRHKNSIGVIQKLDEGSEDIDTMDENILPVEQHQNIERYPNSEDDDTSENQINFHTALEPEENSGSVLSSSATSYVTNTRHLSLLNEHDIRESPSENRPIPKPRTLKCYEWLQKDVNNLSTPLPEDSSGICSL